MESTYVVPVIPYNLSKNETIIQVAEVLDHLTKVSQSLLGSINDRIEKSNQKLQKVSERINTCNTKINKLNGAKKATQVFSSTKYPAADVNKQYISLFADVNPPKLERTKIKHKRYITNDEPLEKLQVYHVKHKNVEQKVHVTGLGDMPKDLSYVNDVLLYNSGKNLYKDFAMSDALNIVQQKREQEASEVRGLEPAPYSISERSRMTRSTTQPYFYSPDLGDVPTLDVPLDLPDLPGIADDLRYEKEIGPGIAPSVVSTPHLPDLPAIELSNTAEVNDQAFEVQLPLPPAPTVVEDNPKEIKEEPKEKEISRLTSSSDLVASADQQNHHVEPVLPKPSEAELPPVPNQVQKVEEKPKVAEIPDTNNVHASLMEAIRKAGGARNAKLKSVEQEKEVKKPSSGGDLMADLHAKLSMRRKGISGAKKNDNVNVSSVMEKVSAMIPPPVPKSELTDSTNTEDEEWDE